MGDPKRTANVRFTTSKDRHAGRYRGKRKNIKPKLRHRQNKLKSQQKPKSSAPRLGKTLTYTHKQQKTTQTQNKTSAPLMGGRPAASSFSRRNPYANCSGNGRPTPPTSRSELAQVVFSRARLGRVPVRIGSRRWSVQGVVEGLHRGLPRPSPRGCHARGGRARGLQGATYGGRRSRLGGGIEMEMLKMGYTRRVWRCLERLVFQMTLLIFLSFFCSFNNN